MEIIRIVFGIIFLLFWIIYLGQVISVFNYSLAQKLGFQEPSDTIDSMYQGDVKCVALWDIIVLWTLPVTGLFMVLNISTWPILGLIAGAVYFDTGGRQLLKLQNFIKQKAQVGASTDIIRAKSVYVIFLVAGLSATALSLINLS